MCGGSANNRKYAFGNFIFVIILISSVLFVSVGLSNKSFNHLNSRYIKTALAVDEESPNLEEELENNIQDVLNDIDFTDLETYFAENYDLMFNVFGFTEYRQFLNALISGELLTDFNSVFSAILASVKLNIINILSPLLLVLIIVLISVVFKNIKPKVSNDSISEAIFFICFAVIVTIVTYMVGNAFITIKSSISKMQNQMNGIFPILLLLMNTAGGSISVKAYSPVVLLLSNVVSNIFIKVLLPIVVTIFVLSIVGNLSPKTKLKNLSEFFNSIFKWIIGIVFTVYMGFMSIQGITASAADGISIKTAKYAIKNYVPMLGGYIAEGFEVVRVGAHIIKNAVGFSGIIIIFLTIISPILLLGVLQLSFKLVAGLIEPLSDDRTSALFSSISKSLSMLMVVLIGVAVMYFIVVFLMICSLSGGL